MKIITLAIAVLALAIPAMLLFITPPTGLIVDRDSDAAGHRAPVQRLASR